jgi:hypothetical protein
MPEDLKQIDTSSIAELTRIREEEDRFQERLRKMESSRGTVSQAVYDRVRLDYTDRLAALDAEARPLRQLARAEYAKLRALQAEAERALDAAGLAKEEVEFRRSLGEFEEDDYAKRLEACQQDLSERRASADAIGELRERFRKAFRSDEELEAAAESAPKESAPSGTIVVHVDETVRAASADQTVAVPPPGAETAKVPVTTQVTALPGSAAAAATARMVLVVDGKDDKVFALRHDTNTIGRHPKSEIELPFTEISRRHAEIRLGPEGFRIVDLKSNNGVFVNGQKVQEQVLADGDLIQIGTQSLRYRA